MTPATARIRRFARMRAGIVAVDPDRIEAALAGLGPESRALVELSVIREVADDDIASLLGTDEAAVRSRREDALAQLAAALGADSADEVGSLVRDMRELPAVRWRDDEPAASAQSPTRPSRARPPPVVQPGAKRKRRLAPAAARRHPAWPPSWRSCSRCRAATTTRSRRRRGRARVRRRRRRAGGQAREARAARRAAAARATPSSSNGTLDAVGRRPAGPGWRGLRGLALQLARRRAPAQPAPDRAGRSSSRRSCPRTPSDYRFLDVSLEPADDNRNHSGQSVLRVPLSTLEMKPSQIAIAVIAAITVGGRGAALGAAGAATTSKKGGSTAKKAP